MEITALCITLMMNVLMLMTAHVQHSYTQNYDADSLHIFVSRLQYFEYEQITLTCEGFDDITKWQVRRTLKGVQTICATTWEKSTGPCTIENALILDSGEYWCQATEGQQRSNTITVKISTGLVILESPALPVTEGESVTLLCRKRKTRNLTADFFKDGFHAATSATGEMTIQNVAKSDEGLYKCWIEGSGESSESRMVVRGMKKGHEDVPPSQRRHVFILLCVIFTILLAFLLLLLNGLLHCVKRGTGASTSPPSSHPTTPPQTVAKETFEGVTEHKKRKAEPGGSSSAAPLLPVTTACGLTDENSAVYYTIN
ncbi:low affinity immunoglobulin gamma Fc region receptor III-A-like isoform X2 [Genypterus blacodes]|uniref:low affinity immunoglobulin gamma Fc region receptor III-A-like isoform X2 n=1 Tax=Genypterus blacodes TaxID=154954 RepID=UPI003F776825